MRRLHGLPLAMVLAAGLFGAGSAQALSIVGFAPAAQSVEIGSPVSVDIVADFSDPVVGWGLDLAWAPGVVALSGAPVVGPAWNPVLAPDGDGLAGLAPPGGVSGTGVVLATLTFDGVGLGTSALALSATAGDLTEGIPLLGGGFDTTSFLLGSVEVVQVPEPGLAALLAASLVALAPRPRR